MLFSSLVICVYLLPVAYVLREPSHKPDSLTDVYRRASSRLSAIDRINMYYYKRVLWPSFPAFCGKIISLQAPAYDLAATHFPTAICLYYLDTAWTAVVRGKFKTNVI
jgi:hypothetical protein